METKPKTGDVVSANEANELPIGSRVRRAPEGDQTFPVIEHYKRHLWYVPGSRPFRFFGIGTADWIVVSLP